MKQHFYVPAALPFKTSIQAIWQVERSAAIQQERIIPKGIVEIIFNFSGSTAKGTQLGSNHYHKMPDCFINGFNTAPILLRPPEQQVFFGVQFKPLAVKKLFKTPAGQFSDVLVDLTLIDPGFHTLWLQLAEQSSFELRVALFLQWITRRLPELAPQELLLSDILLDINQYDLSADGLARKLCYSTRHLSRKMIEATGMNTEELLRYKKYLHALHLMHHSTLSLTEIAYQSNFADQSHFIKAFKSYTHMTPGAYYRNKGEALGHVLEDVR